MPDVPDPDGTCLYPCKHHPMVAKYPVANAPAHMNDLTEFVGLVAEGLSRTTFPRPQHQYSSVHVLMISWQDDDLNAEHDIHNLKAVFTDTYRYTAEHFKIPSSDDPHTDLELRLVQTKAEYGRKPDSLLIIYYGGHGETNKRDQHSIWKAWKTRPPGASPFSPSVDWTDLQSRVMTAGGDVLFILDCCFAAGAVDGSYIGRRESLLSSGKTDKASNENTFTKALVQELELLEGHPCPVTSLHALLVQRQHRYKLSPSPLYCSVGKKLAGIVLAPQPESVDTPAKGPADAKKVAAASRLEATKGLLDAQCRILISVSLTSIGTKPLAQCWLEWLRDHAPPEVAAVEFGPAVWPEAVFDSSSSYMIVSIPVAVWNAMSPHAAISFLNIIRSPNRLASLNTDGADAEAAALRVAPTTLAAVHIDAALPRPAGRTVWTANVSSIASDLQTVCFWAEELQARGNDMREQPSISAEHIRHGLLEAERRLERMVQGWPEHSQSSIPNGVQPSARRSRKPSLPLPGSRPEELLRFLEAPQPPEVGEGSSDARPTKRKTKNSDSFDAPPTTKRTKKSSLLNDESPLDDASLDETFS